MNVQVILVRFQNEKCDDGEALLFSLETMLSFIIGTLLSFFRNRLK